MHKLSAHLLTIAPTRVSKERKLIIEALARTGAIEERRRGRLLFGIDLTASRETTLREARLATVAMFETLNSIGAAAPGIGALAVKLVYFRGRDCNASDWEHDPAVLKRALEKVSCKAGYTQIAKVLRLALAEKEPLAGVVFIGDACEETPDELIELAAALGKKGVPLFFFHDMAGRDTEAVEAAGPVFDQMAEVSNGAYCPFGAESAIALRELLSTVAAFSAAGIDGVKQVEPATTAEGRQLQGRLLLGPGSEGKQ